MPWPDDVECIAYLSHVAVSDAGIGAETLATAMGPVGSDAGVCVPPAVSANTYHQPWRPPCWITSPVPSSKSEMTFTLAGAQALAPAVTSLPPPSPPATAPSPRLPSTLAPPSVPPSTPEEGVTQRLFVQVWFARQATPQLPQLATFEVVSMQLAGEPHSI